MDTTSRIGTIRMLLVDRLDDKAVFFASEDIIRTLSRISCLSQVAGWSSMMRTLLIAIVTSGITISVILAQTAPKAGSCPPTLPLEICEQECKVDNDCKGNYKCCGTKCGGAVCTFPVSIRQRVNRGECPNHVSIC